MYLAAGVYGCWVFGSGVWVLRVWMLGVSCETFFIPLRALRA
jgi:hypothetical protein